MDDDRTPEEQPLGEEELESTAGAGDADAITGPFDIITGKYKGSPCS